MASLKNALVVDDNMLMGSLLAHLLMQRGYEVVEVASADAALALLQSRSFGSVWLDIRMQGMSGTELCQHIRSELKLVDLPVVAYTADRAELSVAVMESVGFSDYLFKPVQAATLDAVLARLSRMVS